MADEIRTKHAPFHWWLEFPEVFYAARPDPLNGGEVAGATDMEAFVGNPPFLGGTMISTSFGTNYLLWLGLLVEGSGNRADLCTYFFRRAASLLGTHGAMGLVATNTIAQGDTRAIGLKKLLTGGWSIYDATNSMAWPGDAAVTVSLVNLAHGAPATAIGGHRQIDGSAALAISSRLRPKPERSDPVVLSANTTANYLGSKIYGQGFLVTPTQRDALVQRDSRNEEILRPYLGGEEVNTSPTQDFDSYVIDFGERTLAEAERWPDLVTIVRTEVKTERDHQPNTAAGVLLKKEWWRFFRRRSELYAALASLDRCLVTARTSKHTAFSFQPSGRVFSENLVVFPLNAHTAFAVLSSRVHVTWVGLVSSTLKNDQGYRPSDCFDTFPFPQSDPRTVIPAVEAAGAAFYDARASFMVATNHGLTKTYNAMKDPSCTAPAVLHLRRLTEAMDRAVLDAYGWTDLAVPPYCATKPAEREAQTAFEDEVIDRLYVLNAERARDEQRRGAGQRAKGKKNERKPKGNAGKKARGQGSLGF
jgi:hypothetical protein